MGVQGIDSKKFADRTKELANLLLLYYFYFAKKRGLIQPQKRIMRTEERVVSL